MSEMTRLKEALLFFGIETPDYEELFLLKEDYYKRLTVAVLKYKAINEI